jgi:hypothetical protein
MDALSQDLVGIGCYQQLAVRAFFMGRIDGGPGNTQKVRLGNWAIKRGVDMAEKSKIVLSLGAALASLTGLSVQGAEAKAIVVNDASAAATENNATKLQANAHYQVGDDLLGFVMTKQADGTVVAQHSSHASHASHASHVSSR